VFIGDPWNSARTGKAKTLPALPRRFKEDATRAGRPVSGSFVPIVKRAGRGIVARATGAVGIRSDINRANGISAGREFDSKTKPGVQCGHGSRRLYGWRALRCLLAQFRPRCFSVAAKVSHLGCYRRTTWSERAVPVTWCDMYAMGFWQRTNHFECEAGCPRRSANVNLASDPRDRMRQRGTL